MAKFSNYWKDNQKDQFATDYPFFKKQQEAHKKEIEDLRNYYREEIQARDDLIVKLHRRVTELTEELEKCQK